MTRTATRFCCALVFWVFAASLVICAAGILSSQTLPAPADPVERTNFVHSIELPHFEPELPVSPGRDEYMAVCVSCHSPRYVTMQPPFSQRQWQDTVDKMVNVYGAQMDSDQRTAIIGYLVAIHGPDWTPVESASTDDDFPTARVRLSSPAPVGPVLKLGADPSQRETGLKRGLDLFAQSCAGCHGEQGRGDGRVAQVLRPRPKNLAANRFKLQLLSQVLWNGKRGTAMPSWRSLPPKDLAALAAYVQSLHSPAKSDTTSPESPEQGRKTFMQNCAPCHGESGDGQGSAAANLVPQPANFRLKQPDSAYLLQVVSDGIPGTAMPSWKDLTSESDRRALAGFVRSLFEADEPERD